LLLLEQEEDEGGNVGRRHVRVGWQRMVQWRIVEEA
jgi:hypothetical protein